ncbi:hypothetical protein D3C75_1020010 [compost metagenome]
MANGFWRSVLDSDISFARCVSLRNEGVLTTWYLIGDDFPYPLPSMIWVGQNNDTSPLLSKCNTLQNPLING